MFECINKPKTYLLLGNIFLVFFLILFSNLQMIPFHLGDFLFLTFLALVFALYRPGWCFLLFIGTLPLENINLAPVELGFIIRPYQFFGALAIVALAIRLLSKRIYFKLTKPTWYDWTVLAIVAGGFLSTINAPEKLVSLKLALISATFVALYFLVRNYIQNIEDLKRVIPFFLSSSVIVIFYGIWQNWAYLYGGNHFEVMSGRPNATFGEPDWLGIFLVFLSAVIYILIYCFQKTEVNYREEFKEQSAKRSPRLRLVEAGKITAKSLKPFFLYVFLALTFILLILTVSRSAWLGAFFVYVIFVFTFFTDLRFRNWHWKETSWLKLKIISCLIISILIIYIFHLTNFQLLSRAKSTGTGLQKITISCEKEMVLPAKIDDVAELQKFNCRHINLEEIDNEKARNKFVTEIERNDPNVATRREIYERSLAQIQKHPILGIGWGSIGSILGRDGRGTPLNSSNIFLETWLGAGIVGFLALVILFIYILLRAIGNYFYAVTDTQKTLYLFVIISWFAILIPNMFNAGIFLGFFWVWLAIVRIKI